MRLWVLLLLLPLSGCFRDTNAVIEARRTERAALAAYDSNMVKVSEILADTYRKEANAHIRTKWLQDLRQLTAQADPATGKIGAESAVAFVEQLQKDLDAQGETVTGRVSTMRAGVDKARIDLLNALRLGDALDKFHGKGINPAILQQIVETVTKAVAK